MDEINTHLAAAYLKVAYSDSQAQLNTVRAALVLLVDAVKAERAATQQTDAMAWASIHTGLDTALAAAREVLDDPY